MGEVYGKENRANDLIAYMDSVKADLNSRTADIAEEDKPTVYVGGVSYKGAHGFEGTEANYGPFAIIHAKNLANETGQAGAFNIDVGEGLGLGPGLYFHRLQRNGYYSEDYAANPDYYNSLSAVQEGRVYSQISFRSSAANLETALADAYYAAAVIYPEQFKDIDPIEKAGEIFETFLGTNPYNDLKEAGYEFRTITIGE
jgi:iron complex transport system substrate-binding protein